MVTLLTFPLVWLGVSYRTVCERGAGVPCSIFELTSPFVPNYFADIAILQEPACVEVTGNPPLALASLGPLVYR